MLNRQSRWFIFNKMVQNLSSMERACAWAECYKLFIISHYMMSMVVLSQSCCYLMASFGCLFIYLSFEVDQWNRLTLDSSFGMMVEENISNDLAEGALWLTKL